MRKRKKWSRTAWSTCSLKWNLNNQTHLGSADSPADLCMDKQMQLMPAESSQPISRCVRDTFFYCYKPWILYFFPEYILETNYSSLLFSKLNIVNGLNKYIQASRSDLSLCLVQKWPCQSDDTPTLHREWLCSTYKSSSIWNQLICNKQCSAWLALFTILKGELSYINAMCLDGA